MELIDVEDALCRETCSMTQIYGSFVVLLTAFLTLPYLHCPFIRVPPLLDCSHCWNRSHCLISHQIFLSNQ